MLFFVHLIMQNIIVQLEKIIADYAPQLQQLSEPEFSLKPSPTKWSGKEYLGHLIDSAQNNIRRFVLVQYEDKPHIVYQQDTWVAAANYQNYPSGDLINLLTKYGKTTRPQFTRLAPGSRRREVSGVLEAKIGCPSGATTRWLQR